MPKPAYLRPFLAAAVAVSAAAGDQGQDSPPSDAPASEAPPSGAPAGILPIPVYTGELADRSLLLGDLWGARTDLADRGVQFQIDWTQHLQGVVSGGSDTATRYGGGLDYLLNLDLQQMDLLPGALVTVRAESRYADSINSRARRILPVNTDMYFPLTTDPDDSLAIAVTEVTYTQFLSPKFALFVGKLNTLGGDPNEFASGRGKSQFGNADFIFNPVTALTVPYSTLGGGALWMPSPHVTLALSVFNTADSSTTSGFENVGDGYSLTAEARFSYDLADLPGGQNLGFIYGGNQDFIKVNGKFSFDLQTGLNIPTEDSTWALYWSGWQYLWIAPGDASAIDPANGIPDRRGLGLFARAGLGDEDTLPIDWHLSAGLGARGLIPDRADDHAGIAYFYDSVRSDNLTSRLGLEDHAQGFEAFYNAAITPAARLTFSVQAVDDIASRTNTAVVVGARLGLSF